MPKRVLFICTGNVCRSPMAEGFFARMAEEAGEDIAVGSAGVMTTEGLPPSEHSVTVMREEGIDISGQRSQMLTEDMIEEASHLFTMSRSHSGAILDCFPEAAEKTFVLREFLVEGDLDLDVADPIGGTEEEYRRARNFIKEAMPSVFRFVTSGDTGTK